MNKFDHQREKQNKRKTMQLCWLKINELCRFEKIRKTLNASLLVWYMTYKFLKTVDINFAGFKGNPLNNVANGQFTSLHAQPVNYKKQKKRKKKKPTSRVLGRQNVENMAWAKGKINFIS